jgi:hypothetical protein
MACGLKDAVAVGDCVGTLFRCYQQPDDVTMLSVVLDGPSSEEKREPSILALPIF